MKDILMSIQPYYAYLEIKGIKKIEVRKTKPNSMNWSRKAIVYISKNKKSLNRIPKEDREWFKQYVGKVAYEFICDKINVIDCCSYAHEYYSKETCLTFEQIGDYCNGQELYAWYISNLKIYDKPRELGEFRKPCGNCIGKCTGEHYDRCPWQTITRPPQSYMRIQV